MFDTHAISISPTQFGELMLALGSNEKEETETAAATLRQFCPRLSNDLLQMAMRKDVRANSRVGTIEVVRLIGGPVNLETIVRLKLLAAKYSPTVRRKAAETLVALCLGGIRSATFPAGPEMI